MLDADSSPAIIPGEDPFIGGVDYGTPSPSSPPGDGAEDPWPSWDQEAAQQSGESLRPGGNGRGVTGPGDDRRHGSGHATKG